MDFNCVLLVIKTAEGLETLLLWSSETILPITHILWEMCVTTFWKNYIIILYRGIKSVVLIIFLAQNLNTLNNLIVMTLMNMKLARSWKFTKIQKMWQNTKYKSTYQIKEVVKYYLFLIFTRFLWIHPLWSKQIINTST